MLCSLCSLAAENVIQYISLRIVTLKFGLRFVFQHLPEPNRVCLVGVYAVTLDPLLSLYGIIYVTRYTRLLPKATRVRFR